MVLYRFGVRRRNTATASTVGRERRKWELQNNNSVPKKKKKEKTGVYTITSDKTAKLMAFITGNGKGKKKERDAFAKKAVARSAYTPRMK